MARQFPREPNWDQATFLERKTVPTFDFPMPRAPRIEFEGACYHVMARGNRREPIVFDEADCRMFLMTFGEAATKCGWEVFARAIWKETIVSQEWIAETLNLKSEANASQ